MIRIRDLHHDYGGPAPALRRLDLDIPKGSVFALIGPNGAGKTTLLRVLATLLEPTYGEVLIGGRNVLERPREVRRLVGFMADDFAVYEEMKVLDYLEFFAACYGVPPDEREPKSSALLERVRLGEKRGERIKSLSRGMRQRLCLAKTLIHDPQVLLLDEPASGLDPQARIEFRDLVRGLGREGRTVLISSHILTELADFCDSMAILEKGRCVTAGRIDEIRASSQGTRGVRLRVLGDPAPALAALSSRTNLKGTKASGKEILFSLEGGDEALADLHAALAAAGVRVAEMALERRDLEALFMELSSHDVA